MIHHSWPQITTDELDFSSSKATIYNTLTAAAWVGSAIDGEGMVGVFKSNNALTQSGSAYVSRVVVTNNNLDWLAKFNQLIGGGCTIRPKPKVSGHKQGFIVQLPTRIVAPVLSRCLPFLIIKKKQAMYVLAFRKLVDSLPHHGCSGHEAYERIYMECKTLNSRGEV